jgi:putative Mg2+ transporter-C (MgtC) family protein
MDFSHEDLVKLALAVLFGSLIGAEREYRSKSAGFRTLILVTVGSTLFTLFSIRLGGPGNADRIAANIVTGIGFLGAGAIFRASDHVKGVTTAATIWMAAALGVGVGSGEYFLCASTSVVILLILLGFTKMEKLIDDLNQTRTYRIVCDYEDETLFHYEELFRKHHLKIHRGKQLREQGNITGSWELQGRTKDHEELTDKLLKDPKIKAFEF